MRALFVVVAALAAFVAGPALGEDTPPPPAADARSPAAAESARDIARLIFVESRVFDYAIEVAMAQQMPALRERWLQSPGYRRLTPERREALTQYFDNMDDLIREEIDRAMPQLVERGAAITLNTFSDAEIAEIAPFMRRDVVRNAMFRALTGGVDAASKATSTAPPEPTPEELMAFAEFSQTPAGRAFEARVEPWMTELGGSIEVGLASVGPAVMQRIMTDMCAIMGPQCPSQLQRQTAAPT